MKNNKGFTLVELLGAVTILAIIMGLAIISYSSINKKVDDNYYADLEQSILMSTSEYFHYNKNEQPSVFGDPKTQTISNLINGGYIDSKEIKSAHGDACNLEESYVGAYKDSSGKTNYYVCLSCSDYEPKHEECKGNFKYSLDVRAREEATGKVYDLKGKEQAEGAIILTIDTSTVMSKVILQSTSGVTVGTCSLNTNGNIKTCNITVTQGGSYEIYATGSDKETSKEKIVIDIK